jgi:hypothetical protein
MERRVTSNPEWPPTGDQRRARCSACRSGSGRWDARLSSSASLAHRRRGVGETHCAGSSGAAVEAGTREEPLDSAERLGLLSIHDGDLIRTAVLAAMQTHGTAVADYRVERRRQLAG